MRQPSIRAFMDDLQGPEKLTEWARIRRIVPYGMSSYRGLQRLKRAAGAASRDPGEEEEGGAAQRCICTGLKSDHQCRNFCQSKQSGAPEVRAQDDHLNPTFYDLKSSPLINYFQNQGRGRGQRRGHGCRQFHEAMPQDVDVMPQDDQVMYATCVTPQAIGLMTAPSDPHMQMIHYGIVLPLEVLQ
ncbi:unnamed protein product [Merluccius merluccius]